MKKHLKITVTGKVQGVFFRANTRNKAQKLNLTGMIKNLPDNSVYIEVEGADKLLQVFIEWCWEGPELAKVENVEVVEGIVKPYTDFCIQ